MELIGNIICIAVFVITYFLSDIYTATWALIVCTLLILMMHILNMSAEKKHYTLTAAIFVLGGMTLWFKNDLFIKTKPTIVFWALGLSLAASHFIYQKSWSKPLLQPSLPNLPESCFDTADKWVMMFYAGIGALNLFIAFNFSTDTWILFKTAGILCLNALFFSMLFLYMQHKEIAKD